MRKIFLHMTITLDGFIAGLGNELDWMLSTPDPDLNQDIIALLDASGGGILGYPVAQGMIPYWEAAAPSASPASREATCPDLGAKIIGDMTQLSTALGNYEDSLTLAQTALYSLPRHTSGLVRAELLGLESRAYAQLGEREAAHAARSAEACVAVYAEAPAEPVPDWIHYMNQAEVDCLAANAYIELGLQATEPSRWQRYAAKAEAHSLNARQARGDGYIRSRIFDEIRLAKVRLGQREPREAAAVATQALQLAADTRSSLVLDWLVRFDHAITDRHPGIGDVDLFHEQLREYLRKAAPAQAGELQ